MLPQEIIRRKRERQTLTSDEIAAFVEGVTGDRITDAQIAALTMAVCLNGMGRDEAVALTLAMRDSGDVLRWDDAPGPVVDKHSTGGVGDNVSLMLAPVLAACGVYVPMISGRGLGHTGGTLDKLEAIPGYQVQPDNALFRRTVLETGAAIIGQTSNLAPADKRIYAIRDVTATVESIPLITASILSKKLAAGLQALVLDVKAGNGAFMEKPREAAKLAHTLVEVANGAGLPTSALITDMNEPLASAAGNAVEVVNAVDFLTGNKRDRRLELVTMALAAELIHLSGAAASNREASAMALEALHSGRAAESFGKMVAMLGGPVDFVERAANYLPTAAIRREVAADQSGFVSSLATRDIGLAVVALGGGRTRPQDPVDHSVGLTDIVPVGARISRGDVLAVIHARDESDADVAAASIRSCISFGPEKPPTKRPVIRRITE